MWSGVNSLACAPQACELMDALKKNLRQEHVLIHEFLSTFYTQVITCIPRISQKSIRRSSPGGGSMSAHKCTSCVWQAW